MRLFFRNVGVLCRKELSSYLTSPMAYIVSAVFMGLSGFFFASVLAAQNYADTSIAGFLNAAQFLILLFAAFITMRLVAEEKKLGTWEFLLTVPLRDSEIVVGKFLASLAILGGMLVLTLYYPLMLIVFGDPDLGPMATSYVGLVLMGSAALAIGIFVSSVTANQIVSAAVTAGILFGLWAVGLAADLVPGAAGEVMVRLAFAGYFPDFVRGIIDTKAIVYYLSLTMLFLFMAVRSIETARWR